MLSSASLRRILNCGSITKIASSTAATPRRKARLGYSPAVAAATNRCTEALSVMECWMPRAPVRCSLPPRPTRCWRQQSRSTAGAVEWVVTSDDVAVQDSLWTAGRRGVGVTVLLEKIVGAAAEAGQDLAQIAALARRINESGRSMGMALTSCTVPAAGKPTFDLPEGEMELGVGIHGEPGRTRVPTGTARDIAAQLVDPILRDLDFVGSPVIVMLNGMGGTPLLELYLMFGEVAAILNRSGVTVARNLVGNYIPSLEMTGCSVTVLKTDNDMLKLWDAPVNTAGLRWGA